MVLEDYYKYVENIKKRKYSWTDKERNLALSFPSIV